MSECATANPAATESDEQRIDQRMDQIKHKIFVMSGKGGVGKSTIAVNMAVALAEEGKKVGLLDIDIHGPSVPTMLGLYQMPLIQNESSLEPVYMGNLKVMSIGFLSQKEDDALIWRGPMKMGVIQQFLGDVEWGELDYLIVDCPPGTGDEPLSICQLIKNPDGAVVVTTPQRVAAVDVRKSLTFCRKLDVPVLGILENMSGFSCPKCGEVVDIFRSGAGQKMANDFGIPFLGALPIDPAIVAACDGGVPFVQQYENTETAKLMKSLMAPILALSE